MRLARRTLLAAPLALATGGHAQAALPLAATAISRLDTPWWKARHAAKLAEIAAGAKPDLVWLGDSITENFERNGPEPWAAYQPVWQRFYGKHHALNLGFKGDATCHLLWRLRNGEVAGIAPRAAVILIGANNMGRLHWSGPDSIQGIEAVVAETRKRLPNTGILLLSVLPSDRNPYVDSTTREINHALAAQTWPARVIFQDVTAVFTPGGHLDHHLFYDPLLTPPEPALHPTAQGMAMLAETIAPNLNRLLQS